MMSHHINPYHYGPGILGAGPYANPVDPLWINTPAPYGPLFMHDRRLPRQRQPAPRAGDGDPAAAAGRGRGGAHRLVHPQAGPQPTGRDAGPVFTLAVLNPLVMLDLIGGAHNDALMLGLLVAGITAAKLKHPVWGVVLCALAAAVKVPAALGIIYIGWDWIGAGLPLAPAGPAPGHRRPDRRRR